MQNRFHAGSEEGFVKGMNFKGVTQPKELIPNSQIGNWEFDGFGNLTVSSVDLKDWRMNALVQFHELVEAILCKRRGITDEQVTAFDALFEEERSKGLHSESDEDGDDPRAPYRKEHFTATNIERILALELGVDWKEYEQRILEVFNPPLQITCGGVQVDL